MSDHRFERSPYPAHPNRCVAAGVHGQCNNLGLKDGDGNYLPNCLVHGGQGQLVNNKKKALQNYNITVARWRRQLDEKKGSTEIKSLRDEIGLLRILLETRLNRCEDEHDLLLQSAAISDLIMKINMVVQACHKLESSMGHLLDKQAILQFAQVVINIISTSVTDDAQINTIADSILAHVKEVA